MYTLPTSSKATYKTFFIKTDLFRDVIQNSLHPLYGALRHILFPSVSGTCFAT